MRLAIMQPYFFPYIGYFQLISASNVFVLHDDVQYITGGWVNRNRILLNGQDRMITLPVQNASHVLPIKARNYVSSNQGLKHIINQVKQAYGKAPCFDQVFPMVEELLTYEDRNVARFNENLIRRVCDFVGIQTSILTSSGLDKDDSLTGQDRVLEICRRVGATDYTNPIGGMKLYQQEVFQSSGITLRFLAAQDEPYRQQGETWVPFLSVIDVLMFNSVGEVQRLLTKYRLLSQSEIDA